jgi:hypothetical protein
MERNVMSRVMDRVMGKAATVFEWVSVWAGLKDRQRPMDDQHAHVARKFQQWFEREMQRPGASISTATPEAVDRALAIAASEKQNVSRSYFDTNAQNILAERKRIVADVAASYVETAQRMETLRAFDDQLRRFAAACHKPIPRHWQIRTSRLTGPKHGAWWPIGR